MRRCFSLFLLTLALGFSASVRAEVTTQVTFDDPSSTYASYYPALTSHIQAAVHAWTNKFQADVTLRAVVRFTGSTASTATGRSFTNAFSHTDGARKVYMEGTAAKLTGLIPNTDTAPDIDIFINPSYLANELWLDPDPFARTVTVPAAKIDAESIFIHEICHALGFAGFLNLTTGERPADYESGFDEFVTFDGANFFFNGPDAVAIYGKAIPLTYGNTYHLGNSSPRPGADLLPEYLMNGVFYTHGKRYYISELEKAMLRDTGLDVDLQAPVISGSLEVSAAAGAPFEYQIKAGGQPDSYSAEGLPGGLVLNATTGRITGTPDTLGDYNVTLNATNGAGTGTATLVIHVVPAGSLPVVTLTVTSSKATVGVTPGVVVLSLPAAAAGDVIVHYTLKGSAINGTDFLPLKGTVKIKAGKTKKALKIIGAGDLDGASKKVIKLTLVAGDGYTLGDATTAKIKIVRGQ